MANRPKNLKPSDFSEFSLKVYEASATMLELEQWFDIYEELLKVIWWNPEIDTPLALEQKARGH